MKVALAQISTDPGYFKSNTAKIISCINAAQEQSVDLIIFPELALPGYAHMDLVKNTDFVKANRQYLDIIVAACKDITVLLGFVDSCPQLYNAVAVISNKQIIKVVHKQLLPNYDVFYDLRYYHSGSSSDLIEIAGRQVGLGICEDLWDQAYGKKIYQKFIQQGADLLINISASPYEPDKLNQRIRLVDDLLQNQSIPFIYTNLVGAYDCYDGQIVFDGNSFIRTGKDRYCAQAKAFQEHLLIADTDSKQQSSIINPGKIQNMYEAIVLGIRDYFRSASLKRAYIGLSGGIDSALTAALAVAALGKENVIGITLPSKITSSNTKNDALLLASNLGIRCDVRPIWDLVNAWKKNFSGSPSKVTLQNIQARIRGMILMEYTNEDRKGLVISTGNKTELALGYCTMYGDMCGGLAAISDVSKAEVYQLSMYVNQIFQAIPISIINRIPTAELEANQKDVDNLPADYDVLSPLVDDIIEKQMSSEELYKKYNPKVVEQTLGLIKFNEYKRRQAPPGIRVTGKAFGLGRRVPLSHGM